MEPKALFTASTYSHIRNFHLPYIRALRDQGWAVHVACGGAPMELPGAGRVIHLPFEKKMSSPRNFAAARLLHREMAREGYALVSAHTSLAAFFTRLAVRGLDPRPVVVNTSHGYLFDDGTPALKRQILLWAERLTAGDTDLLLTMNGWDETLARRYRLGREIVHIPGVGVDFSRFSASDPAAAEALRGEFGFTRGNFLCVYAAEFSQRKHQETLIRALPLLPERVALLLPGDGALWEDCRALAAGLGVERRVIFPGQVKNMAPWYAASDCAVSSSRSEGLPFNIMEAMYLGLPVAASAVKGHVDLIRDGENGLLFPYGDVEACAACLRRLSGQPELAVALSQRAKSDSEQYSLERVLPAVMDAYGLVVPALHAKEGSYR